VFLTHTDTNWTHRVEEQNLRSNLFKMNLIWLWPYSTAPNNSLRELNVGKFRTSGQVFHELENVFLHKIISTSLRRSLKHIFWEIIFIIKQAVCDLTFIRKLQEKSF